MTILQMITAANRTAQTAERAGERFGAALTLVLRAAERKLVGVVTKASGESSTAILRGRSATRAKLDIQQALEGAGYDAVIAKATGAPLDLVTQAVLALRDAEQVLTTTDVFLLRVEALRALQASDLLQEGDALAYALWQATVRGIFGAQPVADILADLATIIDKKEAQIRTLYDTNISIFGRQVEALQAGNDPGTPFLYLGPDDEKTRPFCRQHVGKVYTRERIDAMENGQLPNVFLTGGGFNCRHTWIEVAKSSELAPLANAGTRAPAFRQAA